MLCTREIINYQRILPLVIFFFERWNLNFSLHIAKAYKNLIISNYNIVTIQNVFTRNIYISSLILPTCFTENNPLHVALVDIIGKSIVSCGTMASDTGAVPI